MSALSIVFAMSDAARANFLTALAFGMAFGLVGSLSFLAIMFSREQIKKRLRENICQPIHVRWVPLALWNLHWYDSAAFNVIYSDNAQLIHKARCVVYRPLMANPFWGSLCVEWLADNVIGQSPLPEVRASDEIIRPKLGIKENFDKPE